MASKWNDGWDSHKEIYSPSEVEAVLGAAGIDIKYDTENDFVSLCPYHGNTDSPAFSTSKRYGVSVCFNPACAIGQDERLDLERLVREVKGLDRMSAKRFILKYKGITGESFQDKFDAVSINDMEYVEFPPSAIDIMHERFLNTPAALDYMHGRGFELKTLKEFKVGFTPAATSKDAPVYRANDMIVVPAYDFRGKPVGLVGRSLEGKVFKNYGPEKNGRGFHKSHIVWNLHNARKYETIILNEGTFDSMRVHQAGYQNVGALLGGSLSKVQEQLLQRHFNHIIIMTDNETDEDMTYHKRCPGCLKAGFDMCQGHKPGRELGMKIAERLPRMRISWAVYDDKTIYANNVKDAAAMTDAEIRQCLRNAISHFEYLDWQS